MKLVVGLGNPGEKYLNTRHNVGFMVVDALASQISNKIPSPNYKLNKKLQSLITIHQSLILAKPQTYMNESGGAVKKLLVHFKVKLPNLWVIHDDLDIPLGSYKIQKGIGPKLHYGIKSIEEELGTKSFWRVRIGVDNRDPNNRIQGEPSFAKATEGKEYVLQDFTEVEQTFLERVTEKVVGGLTDRVAGSK
ncbi:aminoacyl-tRNA hydrolase [Candidatus Woesebacteria bacterium RIFCSPLOWO2_01_FULL_39_10]|uniref:Peptidyl-tRNA hydrolase n=1 Tax=Candidatus Woesebacteria bacterium RIFCSPLOWO2_01_FULL_39_10 TaxID=1802516 RepID=A0A1F8B4W0_9BACT|nr:MAG: aminoacyl-tRNA hydrolase [Candidatus Woesebacteria bacterium RIFCSPLOWO2_01_FULL_39_10]